LSHGEYAAAVALDAARGVQRVPKTTCAMMVLTLPDAAISDGEIFAWNGESRGVRTEVEEPSKHEQSEASAVVLGKSVAPKINNDEDDAENDGGPPI
jgi:hypothetical protein